MVGGKNTLVTLGGKLRRRYGTKASSANNSLAGVRVDRAVICETIEISPATPSPKVYLIMSVFNASTGFWEIWHQELTGTPSAPAKTGTLRGLDKSQAPHELVVARGLCFIRGTPSFPTNDSTGIGAVVFDGTGGSVVLKHWGADNVDGETASGNAASCLISAAVGFLATSGGITATSQAFRINNYDNAADTAITGLSGGTFTIIIDYEQIIITTYTTATHRFDTTVVTRGANGTTAAAHAQGAVAYWLYKPGTSTPWDTSGISFTVNQFWDYAVSGIEVGGNYSNRSIATLPNGPASNVGTFTGGESSRTPPFFNQIPKITVNPGEFDSTNYPNLSIQRTADGGGTWFEIAQIANTGSSQTFTDSVTAAGTSLTAPTFDIQLSTFGPTRTSNSPPPPVASPQIIGSNTPQAGTPMAYFQGRIWYALKNILFFSSQEETIIGVPEEQFPSGVNGNFWRLQHPVVSLAATSEALYVFTTQQVYMFTGSTKNTFSYQPMFDGFGMNMNFPHAVTNYGESVAFLSANYQVCSIENGRLTVLSDPLDKDLLNQSVANESGQPWFLRYYTTLHREWLVLLNANQADPLGVTTNPSKVWVYDLTRARGGDSQNSPPLGGMYSSTRHFWYTPWTLPATCILSARKSESSNMTLLYFFMYDPVSGNSVISVLDDGTTTDNIVTGSTTYDVTAQFNQVRVPAGDHVNQRRVPSITPAINRLTIDRTIFAGDTDPDVYYYKDDLWNNAIPTPDPQDPARRAPSIGYKTIEYPLADLSQRVAVEIRKIGSADDFELQNLTLTYEPEAGA